MGIEGPPGLCITGKYFLFLPCDLNYVLHSLLIYLLWMGYIVVVYPFMI